MVRLGRLKEPSSMSFLADPVPSSDRIVGKFKRESLPYGSLSRSVVLTLKPFAMVSFPSILLLPIIGAVFANAAIVYRNWDLVAKKTAPDGFTRTAALVNGRYPGPILKANKGDTVFVTVNNHLNDPNMRKSTSIVRPFINYSLPSQHILI